MHRPVASATDADVVHEDVDPAPPFMCGECERGALVAVGDVGNERFGDAPGGDDRVG